MEDVSRESALALTPESPRSLSPESWLCFTEWLDFPRLAVPESSTMEVKESSLGYPDTEAPSPDTRGATDTVDDSFTWFTPGDIIGQWMSQYESYPNNGQ